MISDLLLAADLLDTVANPFRTIEEHEAGAARLAALAVHGANVDDLSLEGATAADVDLLSEHVWRWALNEAKRVSSERGRSQLPQPELIEALFSTETDRVGRLLLVESILTHPEVEQKLSQFDEVREPVSLEQLPNVWPRDHLIRLSQAHEGEEGREQTEAALTELGMLLLQIATPGALALLGGTLITLQEKGRERHPLVETVSSVVGIEDEDLARRLWGRRGPTRFA